MLNFVLKNNKKIVKMCSKSQKKLKLLAVNKKKTYFK